MKTLQLAQFIAVQLVGLFGLVALLHGVDQLHRPAALIVGGLLVIAWAIAKSRSNA